MNNKLTRAAYFALALLTLVMGVIVPLRKAEAATTYNNTTFTNLTCSVSSAGVLSANMTVTGIKGTTSGIAVELYVQKRILGLFWKKVDIGCPNNIWTDSTTSTTYSHVFTHTLTSTGTYRVTVTYTVSGSGGADDVITMTDTVTY